MPEISVILPAYREAKNLSFLLPQLREVLENSGLSYEILVVDTPEPKDETPLITAEYDATYLSRMGGDRYGDAYRTGIAKSRGQFLLFMDADGSHPPSFIPELLAHRMENDVVMASRYVLGGGSKNNAVLIGMSKLLNATFGKVLGINCHDISNSFKLYRGEQLRYLHLQCDNFDVIPEILLKLHRSKPHLRLLELPFRFERRVHGESKRNLAWFIVTYFWTLFRLRFSKEGR